MKMAFILSLAVFVASEARAQAQATLSEYELCARDAQTVRDHGSLIFACSRVIADNAQPPEIRSMAYRQRGFVYLYTSPAYKDRAIADYNEAIRLNPKLGKFYYDRAVANSGSIHGKLPGIEEARLMLPDLNKAIELGARWGEVYGERANVRVILQDLDGAILDSLEVLRQSSADWLPNARENIAILYIQRGTAFEARGDKQRAIADYRAAMEHHRTNKKLQEIVARLGL